MSEEFNEMDMRDLLFHIEKVQEHFYPPSSREVLDLVREVAYRLYRVSCGKDI